jgi:hypothetical protein
MNKSIFRAYPQIIFMAWKKAFADFQFFCPWSVCPLTMDKRNQGQKTAAPNFDFMDMLLAIKTRALP